MRKGQNCNECTEGLNPRLCSVIFSLRICIATYHSFNEGYGQIIQWESWRGLLYDGKVKKSCKRLYNISHAYFGDNVEPNEEFIFILKPKEIM